MNLYEISSIIIPLVIAITLHEAAHGYVASLCGDSTAKLMGRVTFNPFKHIDRMGTIILPGLLMLSHSPFLFGYAKPVPVNFRNLKHLRRDAFLVALAGPGINLTLAFISALLLHLQVLVPPERAPWIFMNFYNSITVNTVLAMFNLLPILPLDGGRMLNAVLPKSMARTHARTERYGMMIIALLFFVPALLPYVHIKSANPAEYLVARPVEFVRDVIFHLAGIGNG